jgi:hypothetical protein
MDWGPLSKSIGASPFHPLFLLGILGTTFLQEAEVPQALCRCCWGGFHSFVLLSCRWLCW